MRVSQQINLIAFPDKWSNAITDSRHHKQDPPLGEGGGGGGGGDCGNGRGNQRDRCEDNRSGKYPDADEDVIQWVKNWRDEHRDRYGEGSKNPRVIPPVKATLALLMDMGPNAVNGSKKIWSAARQNFRLLSY